MTELQNIRILPRTQNVMPLTEDGARRQVWRDTNRNQLLARFASARDKGYVTGVTPIAYTKQRDYAMVVKVLRDPPARVPWYVAAVVASFGVSASIGLAAWHARFVLLGMAGAVLGVPVLWFVVTRLWHSGGCPGIPRHCGGCRG
jgi:hypothetical protein